jgi:hypothetical protein
LILDGTVLPQPLATAIEGLAWVFSSQERQPIYGLSLVLLVWSNGTRRIPLGLRLWCTGGPSTHALALEVLSYARNRLRWRPESVLFAAWYPSKALLKRIRDSGGYFVGRRKKHRRFNGQPRLSAELLCGFERFIMPSNRTPSAPRPHWISSSAWERSVGGIVRPRALAVLRLIASSNFVGCSTGKSAGLAPLRILST